MNKKSNDSHNKVRQELRRIAEQCFRQSNSPAGSKINITWVQRPSNASATGDSVLRWGCYSRRCRYPARESVVNISVNPRHWSWLRRSNIACIDGLLTLYAKRVFAEGRLHGYQARWARQGRGFAIKVEDGYIVRDTQSGEAVHGPTIRAAKQTLSARQAESRLNRQWEHLQKRLMDGTPGDMSSLAVKICDSHRAGNCQAGTAAWIERHLPGRTEATISELLAADKGNPRVLAAILAALRRHKYSPRAIAVEKRVVVIHTNDAESATDGPLVTGEAS